MSRSIRILIVEDEPEWVKAIKANFLEIFNDLGVPCTIEVPSSIRECKNLIRSASNAPYDLISLDIHLRNDGSGDSVSGLDLLRIVASHRAAWMVSILTGVEEDETVIQTYGAEKARLLQNELRSRAFTTFPPERLLVIEKPPLNDERLATRLRQICLILRQSLVGRNLFRHLDLECQVTVYETQTGKLIKRDSKEFRRAKLAYEFVKKYEQSPNAEPKRIAEYRQEKKYDILAKNTTGSKLRDAQWIDDIVSLRQIRFGCGEVITLHDNPNFRTIAWLLEHPGEEFTASQIGGETTEIGRGFANFKHSYESDETYISSPIEGEDDEVSDQLDADDEAINDKGRLGRDRDYESERSPKENLELDQTQAESFRAYREELQRKLAEVENATGKTADILRQEIEALETALGTVRRKPVGGKTHDTIKQHKSRAISALREAGQVELAEHLERCIIINGFRFSYNVKHGEYVWWT